MINISPKTKKYLILALTGLGLFALGIFVGGLNGNGRKNAQCHHAYRFINADVVCDRPPIIKKTGYAETQGTLTDYIAGAQVAGFVTNASVYFRDLENGPIFGIDETAEFAPASLLKLPLALVYLTTAEDFPEILQEKISVAKPDWYFTEVFPPKEKIDPLKPHIVSELLMHMLAYSDNNAYGVLTSHLYESGQQDLIRKTFLELGFLDPSDMYSEVLSVRRYGAIFRGLYNASYLSAESSEKVLEWLAMSDFEKGIRGGVPNDVVIAHKFGERDVSAKVKQLHDCGIVYFPKNPYLLCVMTRGKDYNELTRVIQHISEVVYTEVNSRRLK